MSRTRHLQDLNRAKRAALRDRVLAELGVAQQPIPFTALRDRLEGDGEHAIRSVLTALVQEGVVACTEVMVPRTFPSKSGKTQVTAHTKTRHYALATHAPPPEDPQ
jgi:hypothetical protein